MGVPNVHAVALRSSAAIRGADLRCTECARPGFESRVLPMMLRLKCLLRGLLLALGLNAVLSALSVPESARVRIASTAGAPSGFAPASGTTRIPRHGSLITPFPYDVEP